MRKLGIFLMLMGMMFPSIAVWAAETGTLAVFAEDEQTDLYLNGDFVGKGNFKKEITPGTYYLIGKINNRSVYNEVVTVRANEVSTQRVVRQLEKKTLDVRHLGVGMILNGAAASGFQMKWYPGELAWKRF